ncbi:MAG: Holliday junction branch migration protein RuvA [Clostridia bacterium]|nr:Holliday junction branch migration protein RuvA [Clostridia bacterium]
MISYVKGILADKATDHAVVECGGVGFKIYTSYTSLSDPKCIQGSEVVFHTYMYIKEGIMDLYGFSGKEELELFELLISVTGVGAKGALAILSTMPPAKLSLTIATGDAASIKKAPGIGNKTAQRIILELKDKIKNESFVSADTDAFSEIVPVSSNERDEAINALIALGYTGAEAKNAVSKVEASVTDVENIIKHALKGLM